MTDEPRNLFGDLVRRFPRQVGNRLFIPLELRCKAEAMRASGQTVTAIAKWLGVSEATARSRLAVEFERAAPGARAGRPQWTPSAEDRAKVEDLAAAGHTQDQIAEALGVTRPTLTKHCRPDLARGLAKRRNADG